MFSEFGTFDSDDIEQIKAVQAELAELRGNPEKFIQHAKDTARKIDSVPNREQVVKDNIVDLTMMATSLAASLDGMKAGTPIYAMLLSKTIAMIFLLGVHYGREQDADVPPAFKKDGE